MNDTVPKWEKFVPKLMRSILVNCTGRSLVTPTEQITLSGETWNEQVASLVKDVFTPAGYAVERFSKVPYLCEGDLYENFYVLSDTVFVLRPVD